jgi:hypothetical protein
MALVRRRGALVACVVAAAVVCPYALAVDPPPPPTEPTPTVSEPPPATAPGPVATVPSPSPIPPPNVKPDPPPAPAPRKRAPAPKLTRAPKPAPARKPAPAPAVRATARPSSPAPIRAVTPPSRPVRARTPVYPQRATQPVTKTRISAVTLEKQKKKIKARRKPPPAPFRGSKLAPIAQVSRAVAARPRVRTSAARANVVPLPSLTPGKSASGFKQALLNLRWLFLPILGTGVVFLTAVGSRRLFERRPTAADSDPSLPQELWPLIWPADPPVRARPQAAVRRCLIPGCHHEDHHEPAGQLGRAEQQS